MEIYTTEHEQAEAIKKWWEKNNKNVILSVIIVLVVVFGGNQWNMYRDAKSANASAQYEFISASLKENKLDDALDQGAQLIGQFQSTPYATLAALASAKIKVEQGDPAAAKSHLQWVLDNTDDPVLGTIAHLRLARILLQEGEYDKALENLKMGEDRKDFTSIIEELKGDIYVAKKDFKNARLAYQKAVNESSAGPGNSVLQMKLDDLNMNNNTDEANS